MVRNITESDHIQGLFYPCLSDLCSHFAHDFVLYKFQVYGVIIKHLDNSKMFTTTNLVTFLHNKVDLHPFQSLSHPPSLLITTNLFSVSMTLFLFLLFVHLFFFNRFHIGVKSYGIRLSLTYFPWHNTFKIYPCC